MLPTLRVPSYREHRLRDRQSKPTRREYSVSPKVCQRECFDNQLTSLRRGSALKTHVDVFYCMNGPLNSRKSNTRRDKHLEFVPPRTKCSAYALYLWVGCAVDFADSSVCHSTKVGNVYEARFRAFFPTNAALTQSSMKHRVNTSNQNSVAPT